MVRISHTTTHCKHPCAPREQHVKLLSQKDRIKRERIANTPCHHQRCSPIQRLYTLKHKLLIPKLSGFGSQRTIALFRHWALLVTLIISPYRASATEGLKGCCHDALGWLSYKDNEICGKSFCHPWLAMTPH